MLVALDHRRRRVAKDLHDHGLGYPAARRIVAAERGTVRIQPPGPAAVRSTTWRWRWARSASTTKEVSGGTPIVRFEPHFGGSFTTNPSARG